MWISICFMFPLKFLRIPFPGMPPFSKRYFIVVIIKNNLFEDLRDGPVVKTSPSNVRGVGSIPGAKMPHALWQKNQNIKQKQYCNKFNKDFLKMVHIKKYLKSKNRLIHLFFRQPQTWGLIPCTVCILWFDEWRNEWVNETLVRG